jgi:uncharacterized membrane protein YgcG
MPPGPTGRLKFPSAAQFLLGLLLVGSLFLPAVPACAQTEEREGILVFSSEITIGPNRTTRVREVLTVNARGREIVHGLYRDIPTRRPDVQDEDQPTRPRVLGAFLDGEPLVHSLEARGQDELRVKLGDEGVDLPPGEHVIEWSYLMENMVDADVDREWFVFNVTGDRLALPVDLVTIQVNLPRGVDQAWFSAVQGPSGRKPGPMHPCPLDARGGFNLKSEVALEPGQGVSLFLSWPPLTADAREQAERLARILSARPTLVLLTGALLLGLYFGLALGWARQAAPVVADPRAGEWPPDVPPALAGLFLTVDRAPSYFLATLVSMLARGQVALTRRGGMLELSPGEAEPAPRSLEREVSAALFAEGPRVPLAPGAFTSPVTQARGEMMLWLGAEVAGKYLRNNDRFFFPGLALAALAAGLAAWLARSPQTILLQVGESALAALLLLPPLIRRASRQPSLAKVLDWLGNNPRPLLGVVLLALLVVHKTLSPVLPLTLALLLSMAGMLVVLRHLLRRPTRAGLALGETLGAYQDFLAGKGELEPGQEEDLDFFARHLPFALALDLAPSWEGRFEGALSARGVPPVLVPRGGPPPASWKAYLDELIRAVDSCDRSGLDQSAGSAGGDFGGSGGSGSGGSVGGGSAGGGGTGGF